MYTFILVFYYTKNGNSYFPSVTFTLKLPFCEDDFEDQKDIALASGKYDTKTLHFHSLTEIEPSRKPKIIK